jgi:hypothetical protein
MLVSGDQDSEVRYLAGDGAFPQAFWIVCHSKRIGVVAMG